MIKRKGNFYKLDTCTTSLILKAENDSATLVYYGKKINTSANYDILLAERDWFGNDIPRSVFSSFGNDFREHSLLVEHADGSFTSRFSFLRAQHSERPDVSPLPASYGDGASTLRLDYADEAAKLKYSIYYTVYDDCDTVSISASLTNAGKKPVRIKKIASMQLDFFGNDFSVSTFNGSWGNERQKSTVRLTDGIFTNDSKTGSSSPFRNPFVLLSNPSGCYGVNLVYSGNHKTTVEASTLHGTRLISGISDFAFDWQLNPSEVFYTPEAVVCYGKTDDDVSLAMHTFVQNHIVRGKWQTKERPVLVNNWEGTEFHFTREKILEIAQKAADVGAELFVLDDGWFGHRDNDTSSLGDWFDYSQKTGGIASLANEVREMGLKFGIWVEPEMISEDSLLYQKHPDFAMKIPYRIPMKMRNQLMLNLADERVQNYVVRAISGVISETKASYVKWDYNRQMTDCFGKGIAGGEYYHRYILGLYSVLGRLVSKFPNVLFESCASGGGRYDLGMFCFMPQTWTSDNTDARERLKIQAGTVYGYPQTTVGAHVSASPNLQTGNLTPLETRFNIACEGLLGYEMDLTKCSEHELCVIRDQIAFYKEHRSLLQFGTHYRLGDAFSDNVCGFMTVSPDKSEAIAVVCVQNKHTGVLNPRFTCKGLDENATYLVTQRKQDNYDRTDEFTVGGDVLLNGSLKLEGILFDHDPQAHANPIFTRMYVFKKLSRYKKGEQK